MASLEPEAVLVQVGESAGRCVGGRAGEGDADRELLLNELTEPGPVVDAQSLCDERSVCSAARRDEGRVIGKAFR